jgi:hypothetical protein
MESRFSRQWTFPHLSAELAPSSGGSSVFVSDEIVYLQMPKTGSTHATIVLHQYCEGARDEEKHSRLKDHRGYASQLIVSSVRNPWDWYVSLWAFGCTGHGGLWHYFNNLPRSELREAVKHKDLGSVLRFPFRTLGGHPDWRRLYSDSGNAEHFRKWLMLMLGPEGLHVGHEGYASSPVKASAGFMTYSFVGLTTDYSEWMRRGRKCRSGDELAAFADEYSIVDRVLRAEALNEDILSLMETAGMKVEPAEAAEWGRHNVSVRRNYADYYDEETRDLVQRRDRFIIERFGYQPPCIGTETRVR